MTGMMKETGPARTVPRGFTLVELMIALVLTIFLIGGVMAVYESGKVGFIDSTRLSRVQESLRFASDYVLRDIRNAGFRDETILRYGHEQQITAGYARQHYGMVFDQRGVLDAGATAKLRTGRGASSTARGNGS